MPRMFDSDEVHQGTTQGVSFTEIVECPECDTEFDGFFHDPSLSVEDMDEAPTGQHVCPNCGHGFETTFTGWSFFSEAG